MKLKWDSLVGSDRALAETRRVGNAVIDANLECDSRGWEGEVFIEYSYRDNHLRGNWFVPMKTHNLAAAQARVEQEADILLARVRELARRPK